jgi:hypothetical protein
MAHFAKIDENNIVIQVIVIDNEAIGNLEFPESEYAGQKYIKNVIGLTGKWIQTSYNRNFRKNYAGRGTSYDKGRDAFIHPQPYPSWTLNEETCKWEPPTPMPDRDKLYDWDEELKQWKEFEDYDVE